MRALVFGVLLILTLTLSASVFSHIRVFGIAPDFIVLVIVSYAILRGDIEGAIIGFFGGILKDIFFGDIIGLSALIYFCIGFIAGKPFKDFFPENHFLSLILACIAAIVYETAFYFFTYFFRGQTDIVYYLLRYILPAALYTAVFAMPVYALVYFINKRLEMWDGPPNRFL